MKDTKETSHLSSAKLGTKMGESKTLFVGQLSGKTERKFSRTCCKPY